MSRVQLACAARQPRAVPSNIGRRPSPPAARTARWRTRVLGPLRQLWGEKPAAGEEGSDTQEADGSDARVAELETTLPPPALADAGADDALALPDKWASPLAGDSDDVAELRQLLAGTSLEAAPLVCAYDADRDGWSPDAFHARVDRRGPALVVALTGALPPPGGQPGFGGVSQQVV